MDATNAQIILEDVFKAEPVPEDQLIISSCGFAVLSGNLLRYLYIEPHQRRKGKGAALLAQAARRAPGPLKLQCQSALAPYYGRLGFTTTFTAEGGAYHYMARTITDEGRGAAKEG